MNPETIARVANAINRAYCESLGDMSIPDWDSAPDWHKNSILAGVNMHLANPDITPAQSHESWLRMKIADGWTYGEVKDVAKKQHPCVLPYDELPPEQKSKDFLFRAVVHALKGIDTSDNTATMKETIAGLERQLVASQARVPIAVPKADNAFDQHVEYIGKRDHFTDTMYGSKLSFSKGQVRALPGDIAHKLLRHADLFRRFDPTLESMPAPIEQTPPEDDSAAVLEQARIERQKEYDKQNEISDLIDQVNMMTKDTVAKFAFEKFKHEFKPKEKLADMRSETVRMIHQFGVV